MPSRCLHRGETTVPGPSRDRADPYSEDRRDLGGCEKPRRRRVVGHPRYVDTDGRDLEEPAAPPPRPQTSRVPVIDRDASRQESAGQRRDVGEWADHRLG